jgi:DNA repair protein RadA/Sms
MFPGEESASQIKLRSERIGAASKIYWCWWKFPWKRFWSRLKLFSPAIVVIDSIQTVLFGGAYVGSRQCRPGARGFVADDSFSKKYGIPVFLVGHVTKDGSIAALRCWNTW